MWLEFAFHAYVFKMARGLLASAIIHALVQGVAIAGPFAIVPGYRPGTVPAQGGNRIFKFDLKNGFKLKELPIAAVPYRIDLHPNGRHVFLTAKNMDDMIQDGIRNISLYDTITGKYLQRFKIGGFPIGVDFVRKELFYYDYHQYGKTLIVVDLDNFSKKREFATKGLPVFAFYDKRRADSQIKILYGTGNENGVAYTIYDAETNSDTEIKTPGYGCYQTIERQGKKLFLSCQDGNVHVVDIDDPTLVSVVNVGGQTEGGIAASTNSDEVFVGTYTCPHGCLPVIVVLDGMTGAITRSISIPGDRAPVNVQTSEYFPADLYVSTDSSFYVIDKRSGEVKFTSPIRQDGIEGDFVLSASKDMIDSDRLFNWAEDKYPMVFSSPPQRPFSDTADGYYFRYYPGTDTYLGTKGGNVFYLPAGAAMNEIVDLGTMDKFLPDADADGY